MIKHEIKKITHYEYWPYIIFYAPMLLFWFYYSIRTWSFTYFTALNPGMKLGGFFDYSKFELLKQIPDNKRPEHQIIYQKSDLSNSIQYPFIAKPNIGERGKNVQIIHSEKELDIYIKHANNQAIIIQEWIQSEKEYGLFYARFPHREKGEILSITGKQLLTYHGDGKTSLREFIESDSRAYFNKSYFYMKYHKEQDLILPKGEKMVLEYIGNHNRGTYFFDHSDLITPELEKAVDEVVSQINGFDFGRLDVKSTSDVALQSGEFIVLEVNGANSEPTHVYDENYNIIQAYKEVIRHLDAAYQIAHYNIKSGIKPTPLSKFVPALIKKLTS